MPLRPGDAWCSLKPNIGNLKYIRKECPRDNSACGYALAIAMHIHNCQIGLWVAPFVVIYPSSAFDKLNYIAMQDEQIVVFADRNPSTYRCVGASVRISLNEAHAMKISWSSIFTTGGLSVLQSCNYTWKLKWEEHALWWMCYLVSNPFRHKMIWDWEQGKASAIFVSLDSSFCLNWELFY